METEGMTKGELRAECLQHVSCFSCPVFNTDIECRVSVRGFKRLPYLYPDEILDQPVDREVRNGEFD